MKRTYRNMGNRRVNWRYYKKINKWLEKLLRKEIRDEINREVIATIMAKANNNKGV